MTEDTWRRVDHYLSQKTSMAAAITYLNTAIHALVQAEVNLAWLYDYPKVGDGTLRRELRDYEDKLVKAKDLLVETQAELREDARRELTGQADRAEEAKSGQGEQEAQPSELTGGYHRDPDMMTHHYDIDAVWCTPSETISLCTIGHVDHMKDTKAMLCDMFPQFPKSHWQCWAPYMRGDKERSGLWLRVHHTADFEWRKWDTWRLWRPWRDWSDIDTFEQAVEYVKGLKMEESE